MLNSRKSLCLPNPTSHLHLLLRMSLLSPYRNNAGASAEEDAGVFAEVPDLGAIEVSSGGVVEVAPEETLLREVIEAEEIVVFELTDPFDVLIFVEEKGAVSGARGTIILMETPIKETSTMLLLVSNARAHLTQLVKEANASTETVPLLVLNVPIATLADTHRVIVLARTIWEPTIQPMQMLMFQQVSFHISTRKLSKIPTCIGVLILNFLIGKRGLQDLINKIFLNTFFQKTN